MLINTYAKLIKEIWFGANNIIHPSSFKNVLGKVNEIFKGFEQHDSQEFISSVLDIVHEDLNRVKVKPCVEMKTYDSSTLKSGSIESWNGFLLRNQSIIVDFFYGQFISRLKCPKCNVLSYQFDPFSLISVPIPYVLKSEIGFDFIPYDITSKSFSCKVKNNKGDTIADFRKAVGAMLGIDPNSFLIICLDKNSTDMERILGYRHVAKKVCKQYTRRNDRIALVQINPEVWNSADNLGFEKVRGQVLSKFPPIEEKKAEKAKPKFIGEYYYYKKEVIDYRCVEEETDFNNGLDPSIMKVLVHMKTFEKSIYNQFNSRKIEPITPRYIHIKKGSTLAQIHLEVFNLIRPIFNSFIDKNSTTIKIDAFKQLNAVAAIEKIKEELRKPEWEQLLINNGYHEALPYHVRAVSQLERFHSFNACFYCKKAECKGCDIPNDQTALQEFIQSRVMGEFNKYSNNDMFYTENGFTNRLDFEIEINFDEEVLDKIIGGNLKELCNITPYTAKEMEAKKTKSLDECLDSFTVEEQLGEEDTWYCPKCKDHVRAWKKIQINRAPNLLILHLKRFKGTKVYSTNGKIEELVEAPIELDLKKYILDPEDKTTIYQLYGVVNHSGSLGFGHYTANCFNSTRDAWITFNDSSVYQLGNENPISNEAYVLFYKRKDIPFEITNFDLYRKVATPIIVEVTKKEEKKKEESKVPNEEKKEVKLDEPKVMEADGKQKPHANAGVENVKEEEISEHAMNDPTIIKLN
jgi:ubiquitin C-terminal hydrolase